MISGKGITLGGGATPVEFRFLLSEMNEMYAKAGVDQHYIASFVDYFQQKCPNECKSGVWVFVSSGIKSPGTYTISHFVVIDGVVQVVYRKGYNTVAYPLTDCGVYQPTNSSTWCWHSYYDYGNTVSYFGCKLIN